MGQPELTNLLAQDRPPYRRQRSGYCRSSLYRELLWQHKLSVSNRSRNVFLNHQTGVLQLTHTGTFYRAETVVVLRILFGVNDPVPIEVSCPAVAVRPPSVADAPASMGTSTAANSVRIRWQTGVPSL